MIVDVFNTMTQAQVDLQNQLEQATSDLYFHTAIQEAIIAFISILKDFGYTQTLEYYDPHVHQAHPPPQHPLFQ